MPTTQERHALAFLAGLALIAVGVRAVGVQRFDAEVTAATGGRRAADSSLAIRALEAQVAAVDSARRAPKKRRQPAAARVTASRPPRPSQRPAPPVPAARRAPAPINVNTATAAELERLPRVGPALARRIIEWRERHGPFGKPDDLRHVRGIGPSTVRLLDSLVTFSRGPRPLDSEGVPSPAPHLGLMN